jgi:GMP synthase-like glutamine amidotransferase
VLQHGDLAPPGILADWLEERGVDTVVHRVREGVKLPEPRDFSFVASLGSAKSPRDDHDPLVARELALLTTCVEQDIPVLGLCFGGQALATVLGGTVDVLETPELGWHRVQSAAPDVVEDGPWLQWHYEAFTTPPGAQELAWSPACAQAFRFGPHLGTQFHPESTAEIVATWARHDRSRLPRTLTEHLEHLDAGAQRHAGATSRAARRLFDAFLAGVRRSAGTAC